MPIIPFSDWRGGSGACRDAAVGAGSEPAPTSVDRSLRRARPECYNQCQPRYAILGGSCIPCFRRYSRMGLAAFQWYSKLLRNQGFFVAPSVFLMSPSLRYLRLRSTPSVSAMALVISSACSKTYQFSSRRLAGGLFRLSVILEIGVTPVWWTVNHWMQLLTTESGLSLALRGAPAILPPQTRKSRSAMPPL